MSTKEGNYDREDPKLEVPSNPSNPSNYGNLASPANSANSKLGNLDLTNLGADAINGRISTVKIAQAVALFDQIKALEAQLDSLYTSTGTPKASAEPIEPEAAPGTSIINDSLGSRAWDLALGIIAAMGLDPARHADLTLLMQECHQTTVNSRQAN